MVNLLVQMPERPKDFGIPLAALTSNTANQMQTAKSSVSEGGSLSSPQVRIITPSACVRGKAIGPVVIIVNTQKSPNVEI